MTYGYHSFEIIIRSEDGVAIRTDYCEFFYDDEREAWKNALFLASEKVLNLGDGFHLESITKVA